jgi:hypothetical protein
VTIPAHPLTLSAAVLRNVDGDNVWSGSISLNSATILVSADLLTQPSHLARIPRDFEDFFGAGNTPARIRLAKPLWCRPALLLFSAAV